jgi:hypothetical protein
VRIGGTASTTSAIITFVNPIPKTGRKNAMITMLGSARPMFPTLTARNEPRWMCPSRTPSGTAITSATPIAAPLSTSCSHALSRMKPMLSTTNRSASANRPGRKEESSFTRPSALSPTA